MSSVDERIVEMRFDNQQFESGVKTSLNSLSRLENGLDNLGDSASSLSNLQTTANQFDISGISSGIDQITNRFSALGIAADQAIRMATSGLVKLGVQAANTAKKFTFGPISTGFSQYEQETKSVQTLMNATGLGMAEIEKYTQKLGFYVDETSYSYDSMFSTLASMMSSGVENVDTGVAALIGLGNAAGLAGVDASQASHAFEGFGKAIGQGYMDSRTWSWIKSARMDTISLKQAFIDAGVGAGTLVQETDKAGNTLTYVADSAGKANKKLGEITASNMENFFGEHWLDRETMLEGVSKYSDAFEQIYNDYLETGDTAEEIIKRLGGELDEYSLKAFRAANQTRTFTDVVEYISGAAARRWSTAFKKIFGNFEESTELWASLIDPMYEIFITPLDNMNDLLDNWRELGGYEHVVSSITSAFEGLVNIVTTVRSAFHDIFPKVTGERLFSFTEGLSKLTAKFADFTKIIKNDDGSIEIVNKTFGNLIDGFKGGLSVISLVGKAFKTFFASLSPTAALFKSFGNKVIEAFGKVGRFLTDLKNSEKVADLFSKVSEKLINIQTKFSNVMEKVNSKFTEFVSQIKDDVIDGFKGIGAAVSLLFKGLGAIGTALSPLFDIFKKVGKSLGNFALSLGIDFASIFGSIGRFLVKLNECNDMSEVLASTYEKIAKASKFVIDKFNGLKDSVKSLYEGVKTFIKSNFGDSFKDIFKDFDFGTVAKAIAGLGAVLAGVNIGRLIGWFIDDLKYVTDIPGKIKSVLQTVEDAFWAFGENVSADVIRKIAIAIGLLALSLMLLGSVKPESLVQGLLAITVLFAELYAVMYLFKKNDIFKAFSGNFMETMTATSGLLKLAGAVLILAVAVKMLSSLDATAMSDGLVAVMVLLGALTLASTLISKYAGNMAIGAAGMIGMAAAVLILSAAVKVLSGIDSGFADGLFAVVTLLGALALAGIAMSKFGGKLVGVAVGMIGMAAAIVIMAEAAKKFSAMDVGSLGNSIFAITALLAVIAAFNRLGGSAGKMLAAGASLLAISAAFVILGVALNSISSIDASSLGNSIFGITALLAVIGAFNQLGGSAGKMLAASASLLVVSAALVVMSGALAAISAIDASSLGNSIFGITALLAVIAAFNQLGGSALNMIGMAAGLLVMSVALMALVPSLLAMGAAAGTAVAGILVLAGIFVVLGAAAFVLMPVIPAILALSAALLIISAAVAVAGAGLLLLSAGLTAFAGALTVSAAEIIAGLNVLILGLASIASSIVVAVAAVVSAIALGLASAVPTVVAAALQLVLGILNALVQNIPAIAVAGIQLIVGLINAIASQIGPLVDAGINLIVSFINGMADAIDTHGADILAAVGKLIGSIIGFLGEALAQLLALIPGIGDKAAALVREGANKIKETLSGDDLSDAGSELAETAAEGVTSAESEMEAAGEVLSEGAISGVEESASDAEAAGEDEAQSFIDGLTSLVGDANDSGSGLSGESLAGVTSLLGEFGGAGGEAGNGFIEGIKSKYGEATAAGAGLGNAALTGAKTAIDSNSPSKEFMYLGEYSGEGYCVGMKNMLEEVYDTSEDMGDTALDAVANTLKDISDYIDSDENYSPVITPVVDFTNIRAAGEQIGTFFWSSIPLDVRSRSSSSSEEAHINELINVGYDILRAIQNGSDLYFDDGTLAGRINRRLGFKV